MGTELIIPGTPFDRIPPEDQRLITLNNQNGYPGPWNLAQPGAGGSAIIERYPILAQVSNEGGQFPPQEPGIYNAQVAVPGTGTAVLPFMPAYIVALRGDVWLDAGAAQTAEVSALIGGTWSGETKGPLRLDGNGLVRISRIRPALDLVLQNANAAAVNVNATVIPDYRSMGVAALVWTFTFPFSLGANDILRLRLLSVSVQQSGGNNVSLLVQAAQMAINQGGGQAGSPFQDSTSPLIGIPTDFRGPAYWGSSAFTPINSLGQVVVYGYDFNAIGKVYTPQLAFSLSVLDVGGESAPTDLVPRLYCEAEVYRNAISN